MNSFSEYLLWERSARDTIDFKRAYVDMAGDLIAGLMLSQIIYWFLPNSKGESKIRIRRDGYDWLAKRHQDWFEECRITEWQAPRALTVLEDAGLVVTKVYKFNGAPTTHIRIDKDSFLRRWREVIRLESSDSLDSNQVIDQDGIKGKSRMQPGDSADSLTKTTSESTSQTKGNDGAGAPAADQPQLEGLPEPEPQKEEAKPERPPQVQSWVRQFKFTPTANQQKMIVDAVDDPARWETVLQAWAGQGYSPKNVTGQLDWYSEGIPDYAKAGGPQSAGPRNGRHRPRDVYHGFDLSRVPDHQRGLVEYCINEGMELPANLKEYVSAIDVEDEVVEGRRTA